ncbi:MAG: hypothetical protein AAF485_13800, partial [Chloroflexota bacterium]
MVSNNLIDQITIFLLIAAGIAIFIAIRAQAYSVFRRQEQQTMAMWQKFAQINGLRFSSSNFFNWNIQVKGVYRAHYVELYTTMHKDENDETEQNSYFTRYRRPLGVSVTVSPDTYFCTNVLLDIRRGSKKIEAAASPSPIPANRFLSRQQVLDLLIPNGLVCRSRRDVEITIEGGKIRYRQEGFEANEKYLSRLIDMLCDIVENEATIVSLGGEVISALQKVADNNNLSEFLPHR